MSCRGLLVAGAVLMGFCSVTGAARQEDPAGAAPDAGETAAAAARQNPILRDFYRRLYPGLDGSFPPSDEFLESFIDRQIDAFAADIDRRLTQITDRAAIVERLIDRRDAAQGEGRHQVERSLKAVLRLMADDCDGLADRLQLVFAGLNRRGRNREPRAEEDRDPYVMLFAHIQAADRAIRDYLFTSRQVVRVEDLEGEDMLMRLDAAEKLARELSR